MPPYFKQTEVRPTSKFITCLAVAAALTGCAPGHEPDGVIFSGPGVLLTADSVVSGAHTLCTAGLPASPPAPVQITIGSSPLLTAAARSGIAITVSAARDSVADASLLMRMAMLDALVSPDSTVARLRAMLGPDSLPRFEAAGTGWPIASGRCLWALAAWQTYCTMGSREWLAEAERITSHILDTDRTLTYHPAQGLLGGSICSPAAHSPVVYPRWMGATERFESMCLANNAAAVGAWRTLAAMRAALGLGAEAVSRASHRADSLASAINDWLWIPSRGYYSEYLYGSPYPMQSPATDNFGQALALLTEVATPEMAASVLTSTPLNAFGPEVTLPSAAGTPPYPADYAAPEVSMLWGAAAASRQAREHLLLSIAALARAAMFPEHSDASLTGLSAITLGCLAGVAPQPDALRFHPAVPRELGAGLTIEGLPWRRATLTVSIAGFGSRIASFAIDSVESPDYFVPDTLTGAHNVHIKLANNALESTPAVIARQQWMPAVPELEFKRPHTAMLSCATTAAGYDVYVNGVMSRQIDQNSFEVKRADVFTQLTAAPLSQAGQAGYAAKPLYFYPPGSLTTLQAEEFAAGGTDLVRGRRTAERFVENSPLTCPTLVVELPEPDSSQCFIDVCYANGSGPARSAAHCAIRMLSVNSVPAGALIMPARGDGWWLSTAMSNTLSATLRPGLNTIAIISPAVGEPGSLPVLIDYIRVVRTRTFTPPLHP